MIDAALVVRVLAICVAAACFAAPAPGSAQGCCQTCAPSDLDPITRCCREGTCRPAIAVASPAPRRGRTPRVRRAPPVPDTAPAPRPSDPTRCRGDEACIVAAVDRLDHLHASEALRYLAARPEEPRLAPRAEYAARGLYLFAEAGMEALGRPTLGEGRGVTEDWGTRWNSEHRALQQDVERVVRRYEAVLPHDRTTWSVRALERQGRAYEIQVVAVLHTTVTLPRDLERRIRGASREVREEVRIRFEDQVRQHLDNTARPVECQALARYLRALRLAQREGVFDTRAAAESVDRVEAYGPDRTGECAQLEHQRDPSFALYRPGEFAEGYRQMCEGTRISGCVPLAFVFLRGEGVPPETGRGVALLEQTCARARGLTQGTLASADEPRFHGGHLACTRLAGVLATGELVPPNAARANELWNASCAAGYEEACREREREQRRLERERARLERERQRQAR